MYIMLIIIISNAIIFIFSVFGWELLLWAKGREGGPSVSITDSQSVKGAQLGALRFTRRSPMQRSVLWHGILTLWWSGPFGADKDQGSWISSSNSRPSRLTQEALTPSPRESTAFPGDTMTKSLCSPRAPRSSGPPSFGRSVRGAIQSGSSMYAARPTTYIERRHLLAFDLTSPSATISSKGRSIVGMLMTGHVHDSSTRPSRMRLDICARV